MPEPWWRSATIYQVYPRSFLDSDGDGVGDLEGARSRLEYLSWLSVDAVWLSPLYRSPMRDFGYDVSDYCDVDPLFVSLNDFDSFVADGFRIDPHHALGKAPPLPDDPPEVAGVRHSSLHNDTTTHAILRRLRQLVDGYPGDRILVGEVFLLETSLGASYYGDGDELHLAFNFPPLFAPWDAPAWREELA